MVLVHVNIIEVKSFENRNSEGGTYFDLQDEIRTEEQLACIWYKFNFILVVLNGYKISNLQKLIL